MLNRAALQCYTAIDCRTRSDRHRLLNCMLSTLVTVTMLTQTCYSQEYELVDLGTLYSPGSSDGKAINDSGSVVGTTGPGGTPHAFVWTSKDGLQEIAFDAASQARHISSSGLIVGQADSRPFKWNQISDPQFLGLLPGHNAGLATCSDGDGDVYGWSMQSIPPNRIRNATVWGSDLIPTVLPSPAGLNWTEASACNSHGAVVGLGQESEGADEVPLYWPTATSSPVVLELPSQHWISGRATSINDFDHIVVHTSAAQGKSPSSGVFIWSPANGYSDLGMPASARDVRAGKLNNSATVVGSYVDLDGNLIRPYIWSATTGMQDLNTAFGFSISSGTYVTSASDISDNGTVTGRAVFAEPPGFRAFLLETTGFGINSCHGDCDGSGTVDFSDLVAMLFEFGSDTMYCDADQTGTVNFNDLTTALFLFGPCE